MEVGGTICHLGEMVEDGVDDTLEFCTGQERNNSYKIWQLSLDLVSRNVLVRTLLFMVFGYTR